MKTIKGKFYYGSNTSTPGRMYPPIPIERIDMKTKRISCKKLADYMKQFDLQITDPYTAKDLREHCEAFGKSVFCYLDVGTVAMRKLIEKQMKKDGIKFGADYSPDTARIEIGVTYFKAWHWDE